MGSPPCGHALFPQPVGVEAGTGKWSVSLVFLWDVGVFAGACAHVSLYMGTYRGIDYKDAIVNRNGNNAYYI